jgi:hypothetical protein
MSTWTKNGELTLDQAILRLKEAGYKVFGVDDSWTVHRPVVRGGPILSNEQVIAKAAAIAVEPQAAQAESKGKE